MIKNIVIHSSSFITLQIITTYLITFDYIISNMLKLTMYTKKAEKSFLNVIKVYKKVLFNKKMFYS